MMIRQRVMRNRRRDEIARDQFGALVDQLIERVLAISARLAPDNRAGLVIHGVAVTVNVFTVGFHIALLEVRREAVHVLVVRQNRFGFGTKEVVVPDANQRQQHRQVFLKRRGGEVFVHLVRAGEQLDKVVVAHGQNDRETNRRPEGVTAADPVPELKHVRGIDAEIADRFRVGGERREVLRHMLFVTGGFQEPVARAVGVGHGFLSGEGFGRHQEQGAFRVHLFQHFGDVGAIDVGDKVHVEVIFVRAQGFGHHERAEVRAADTDVHHVSDRLAGIAFPFAGDNGFGEFFHLLQHGVHFRHHIFAVHQDRRIAAVAQRDVQHGAVFGAVDLLAGEHGFNGARQIGLFCQIQQFAERFFRDAVFRVVHQHLIVEGGGEFTEAVSVFGEEFREGDILHRVEVIL
ncbi:hypothetical protein BN136_2180 [Cronobacter universalis NCTC 9529]|nr:hypothetical protein BN136_2180 [Cronobacter universalis NCTC 9529]